MEANLRSVNLIEKYTLKHGEDQEHRLVGPNIQAWQKALEEQKAHEDKLQREIELLNRMGFGDSDEEDPLPAFTHAAFQKQPDAVSQAVSQSSASTAEKPRQASFIDRLYKAETIATFLKRNPGHLQQLGKPPTDKKKRPFKPKEPADVNEPAANEKPFDNFRHAELRQTWLKNQGKKKDWLRTRLE